MDIKKQIRQTFVSKARDLKNAYHNGFDIFYFDIPEETKGAIRKNFQLSFDEDILFFRDTSFWSSSSQGMVITTSGIHLLPENNSPEEIYAIGWSDILKVEYKDLNIYISYYNGDLLPLEINFFFKKNNVDPKYAQYFADVLTEIACLCEPQDPSDDMLSNILMLIEEEKFLEANAAINEYHKLYGYQRALGWEKVQMAIKQEDFSKAQYESERLLQAIEEADNPEAFNEEKSGALNAIGYIYLQQENYAEARRYYFNSIQFSPYEESKNFKHQKFQDIDKKYNKHFAK